MMQLVRRVTFAVAMVLPMMVLQVQAQVIENEANAEETASVIAAIAQIGCRLGPSPVEKEGETLFEIDDADCAQGQYDIKLERCPICGALTIFSMTFDGPKDASAIEEEATGEEIEQATAAIAALNCELGEGEVEKESPDLFEIDDAVCDAGQFDIKLDGDFAVINLTRDYD